MPRKHNKLQMQALTLLILLGSLQIGREIWRVEHPKPVIEMVSPQLGRACVNGDGPVNFLEICTWEATPVTWGDITMHDDKIFVKRNEQIIERVEF